MSVIRLSVGDCAGATTKAGHLLSRLVADTGRSDVVAHFHRRLVVSANCRRRRQETYGMRREFRQTRNR